MTQERDHPGEARAQEAARGINARLVELGWDQAELVRRSGVSATTIRWLQTGAVKDYRKTTLAKVSRSLGWPPAGLYRTLTAGDPVPEATATPAGPATRPEELAGEVSALRREVAELRQLLEQLGISPGGPGAAA